MPLSLDLLTKLGLKAGEILYGLIMSPDVGPAALEVERKTSRKIAALSGLLPFVLPYRGLIAAAVLALIVTAAVSLLLPLGCAAGGG